MTTPDPLLERLRRLARPTLNDVAAARTLARAEAEFVSAGRAPAARRVRWTVPAALALWGALYSWGAVRELGRLFPAAPATPAVAANHRGPSGSVHVERHEQGQRDQDDDDHDRAAPTRYLASDLSLGRRSGLVRSVFGHGSLHANGCLRYPNAEP